MANTKLSDISKEFDMKVAEFADAMGYTREALHISLKTGDVNHWRMHEALKKMQEISNEMYIDQTKDVLIAKSRREQVLASLAQWFGMSLD